MGARHPQILWLMLRQLALPVFVGLGLGVLLTQLLAGTVERFLLGIQPAEASLILFSLVTLMDKFDVPVERIGSSTTGLPLETLSDI